MHNVIRAYLLYSFCTVVQPICRLLQPILHPAQTPALVLDLMERLPPTLRLPLPSPLAHHSDPQLQTPPQQLYPRRHLPQAPSPCLTLPTPSTLRFRPPLQALQCPINVRSQLFPLKRLPPQTMLTWSMVASPCQPPLLLEDSPKTSPQISWLLSKPHKTKSSPTLPKSVRIRLLKRPKLLSTTFNKSLNDRTAKTSNLQLTKENLPPRKRSSYQQS